jgi:hypothetical protein
MGNVSSMIHCIDGGCGWKVACEHDGIHCGAQVFYPAFTVCDVATVCDVDNHNVFGSFCSANLDSDHTDDDPKVKAASCMYLSKSHHIGCSGHFVWDYVNRRRLTVPSISNNQWNYFPLRAPGTRHVSTALTLESPPMPGSTGGVHTGDISSTLPIPSDYEPACAVLPRHRTHLTRLQKEMHANIGRKIRKMFFVDDK